MTEVDAEPRPSRPRGFAITALILGIVAFLLGWFPWIGLILAVAAVAVGIVALVKRQPKAFSITGTALGAIALLTALFITVSFSSMVASNRSTSDQAGAELSSPRGPSEADPIPDNPQPSAGETTEPATDPAPSSPPAPPAPDGSVSNPLPQPYIAKGLFGGEKYSLTARLVDTDAGEQLNEWNQFNDQAPAGFKYVVVEVTMTGIDPDGIEPSLAEYDLSLATGEGNRYDGEYVILGDGMPSLSDGPTLYPGNSFTGYTAYIVPAASESYFLHDNGSYISF